LFVAMLDEQVATTNEEFGGLVDDSTNDIETVSPTE